MDSLKPRFVARDEIIVLRPRVATAVRFEGLWIAGSLDGLQRTTVAVVGSRAPSDGGRQRAHALGTRLTAHGICVISGLALGIDGAAHAGAVSENAPTIGVLGGGHGCFFPRRNRALAEAMIACGGAVISPFPPDHPALPPQFLQRNGIVAALADAVVIVEAAARSGALNTASWAADLGIPVFAFPGEVDRPKVAGCLALIRDGATLVRDADDVIADLGIATEPAAECGGPMLPFAPDSLDARLLAQLHDGETGLDELAERSGAGIAAILSALTHLEIAGRVERRLGNRYALTAPVAAHAAPAGVGRRNRR